MNKYLKMMRKERMKIEKTKALLKYNIDLSLTYRQNITTAWKEKNFAVVSIYGKLLGNVKHNIRAFQFGLYESKHRVSALNKAYDMKKNFPAVQ